MAIVMAGLAGTQAKAQATLDPDLTVELATDERRRGLSWSDEHASARAALRLPLGDGPFVSASVASLGGSNRHGGADAVIDLSAGYARNVGAWRLSADVVTHRFAGVPNSGFLEFGGSAAFTLGPAMVDAFARFAPAQDAIGGQTLYIGTGVQAGIPGTPLSLSAHVGRSTGTDKGDDLARFRLRPQARYHDWSVGLDYVGKNWSAGLRYTDTNIARALDNQADPALVARVALFL
ncbi:TorF family putative porin [Sphingobium sp. CR28]|uniref:TorF family putative porin n=1 Tax=Sphingobium sp. CR28 TaxID=3400272 RepID=UPI003FF0C15D